MKVTINLDMTPEEARKLMGMPDVESLQKEIMDKMCDSLFENMEGMTDPEFFLNKVFPVGVQSMESFQNMLSGLMTAASSGANTRTAATGKGKNS